MTLRPDFDDAALTRAGRRLARDLGPAGPRPLPLAPPRRRGRSLRRTLAAAGAVALLSVLASERRLADPAPARGAFVPRYSAGSVAPPAWTEVAADRYRLAGADAGAGADAVASARTQAGLREDILTAGTFDVVEAPFLRLVATEAAGTDGEGSLFVVLARRAADAGGLAVVRTSERGQVESRLGAVETIDAVLGGTGGTRACTAFRVAGAPVRIDGWLCAPLGQLPEPRAVACAVDRLSALPGAVLPGAATALTARPARAACLPEEPATTAAVPAAAAGKAAPAGRIRKNAARVRRSREASP
ncbi:hypothetical protein OPKNFCMD_0297 [Methylobacterium crusticola]|uniref:Uncharacterized protein n=1 Tax=Methylobacterium crusticola TaxID=1697972 RepID=A0ABQ4QRJ9_9HYPH|nr:hypothetical protein [Methylobacterium crusticola]GJD47589.1 hypothetical protein OPKNFCMD_0297 [Methylobacterium crusticola]